MRLIWAASSGEYSDYRVNLLFTSQELAQQHADKISGYVEEFQLWDEPPPTFTVYTRRAWVEADGSVTFLQSWEYTDHGAPTAEQRLDVRVSDPYNGGVFLNVDSTDLERLNKVWGERLAKLRAERSGL